jgi:hypothetical protein
MEHDDASQDEEDGSGIQDVERFVHEEPADGERDNRRDVRRARRGDGSEVPDDEVVEDVRDPGAQEAQPDHQPSHRPGVPGDAG